MSDGFRWDPDKTLKPTLREQLRFFLECYENAPRTAKAGHGGFDGRHQIAVLGIACDWTIVRMRESGECQGDRVARFRERLASYESDVIYPLLVKQRGSGKWPQTLILAGDEACAEVRSTLDAQPAERLPVRRDSLLARLAVTVLANGGVLSKERIHALFAGASGRSADHSLSLLMIPSGRWTKQRFGTISGEYLRLGSDGRRFAERLRDAGVEAFGAPRRSREVST